MIPSTVEAASVPERMFVFNTREKQIVEQMVYQHETTAMSFEIALETAQCLTGCLTTLVHIFCPNPRPAESTTTHKMERGKRTRYKRVQPNLQSIPIKIMPFMEEQHVQLPDSDPTASWPIDPSLLLLPVPDSAPELNGTLQTVDAGNIIDEVHAMNQASYDARDRIQKRLLSDTTTQRQYQSYIKAYVDWWEQQQYEHVQVKRQTIPAFPIIPGKVALFLEHTIHHPKRGANRQDIPGTTVGRATIQTTINALEWERSRTAHNYKDDPEAQKILRSDDRIKRIEFAVKHNEPQRIQHAQILKASGTSADTYTREQMIEISLSCLTRHDTLKSFAVSVRDRALYLLPLCTAFRGDNMRQLCFSDLFSKPIINVDAGLEKEIMCLRILCDNAKHNQSGKVEEQGAIRHRLPELCCIGALALHLFIVFECNQSKLDWMPDFSKEAQDAGFGTLGRRAWMFYKIFPGGTDIATPMTYQNHSTCIHLLHKLGGANLSKVTHATHYTTAFIMRAHGTAKEEAKAVGWSTGDSYNSVYDRELPIEALLGAAMFNARKPEAHFCARETLDAPDEITCRIFPWVEAEIDALRVRAEANHLAKDLALLNFLTLLQHMRRVLVQDLAILYAKVPDSFIYTYHPFNSQRFREFALNSTILLAEREEMARLALANLPKTIAQTFEGALQTSFSQQQHSEESQLRKIEILLEKQLQTFESALEYTIQPQKRCKLATTTQPIRTMLTAPPIPAALHYRESYVDEDSNCACMNMPGTTTIISPPDMVIVPSMVPDSVSIYRNNIPSVAPTDGFSVLPQLTIKSQHVSIETWSENWKQLLQRHSLSQLTKHTWDWEGTQLVPYYNLQPVKTLEDIWKEYTEGLDGFLPLRDIKEHWGNSNPAWHRNLPATKTPLSRRKRVTDLIERLSKRPHWSIQRALKFLDSYCGPITPDKFARILNNEYLEKLMAAIETDPIRT